MKCASKLTERENCVTNTEYIDNKYCVLKVQVNLKKDVSPNADWCSVRAAVYTVDVNKT